MCRGRHPDKEAVGKVSLRQTTARVRSHWHSQPPANRAKGREASGKLEPEQEAAGTVSLRQTRTRARSRWHSEPPANRAQWQRSLRQIQNPTQKPLAEAYRMRVRFAEGLFGAPHLPKADCAAGFLGFVCRRLTVPPAFLDWSLPKACLARLICRRLTVPQAFLDLFCRRLTVPPAFLA